MEDIRTAYRTGNAGDIVVEVIDFLKSYSTEIIKWLVGKTYEDKQVLLDETLDLIKGAALVTKVMTGVNEQLPFVVDLITAEPEVRYTFHHDMDGKIGNLKTFSVYSFFEHIEAGDTSSVRLFIENGMDVNARYGDGDTALLRAARRHDWAE